MAPLLDRAAQLPAAGGAPGVRRRGRGLPAGVGAAVGRRPDHRGVGRVPGHRLRAGHARASSWSWSTARSDHVFQWQPRDERRRAAEPGRPGRAAEPRTSRRCTATPSAWRSATCGRASPSWRSTCCTTAGCGTGRSGGTSTSSSRSADADYDTYRQVMVLIGSLFRRLAPGDAEPGRRVDEDRERYMWTRMREHLAATGTDPADCLYVCGAFHAASRVAEFGVDGTDTFEISPRTAHHLAVRPDPVQPRGDRGAVRPRRRLGVDRRRRRGRRTSGRAGVEPVPARGPGGREEGREARKKAAARRRRGRRDAAASPTG